MSLVTINDTTLSSIGDAIREKNGTTDTYKPSEMPQAILSIETGGESSGDMVIDEDFAIRCMSQRLTNEEVQSILDYSAGKEYTYVYNDEIGATVTDKINSILAYKFYYQADITNINIPEGYIHINQRAFANCYDLKEVTLPATLNTIDYNAFGNCFVLSKVTFKGTPTNIHSSAFYKSTAITDIYVPWAEGVIADAPWGATNATVYDDTGAKVYPK